MGHDFRPVERDQQYLMPVSLRDWLPPDDLAWFVVDAVGQMDLAPLRARYREDGWGAAAYDPALMVALLLYAYATGERSSRRIEARCRRDVAYRVICANQTPDHATIARFRAGHEAVLQRVFGEVLRLCAAAGLGRFGLVALDGTRIAAAASMEANRTADALDAEIAAMLAEAAAVDAAEDAALGPQRRGDELPAALAEPRSRLARLAEARRQLAEQERAWHERNTRAALPEAVPLDEAAAAPGPAEAPPPRARRHRPNRPGWQQRNTTDPECRKLIGHHGWLVGYNAQAVVSEDGLVLAHGLTQNANDTGQLEPLLAATLANTEGAGYRGKVRTLLADGGYWSEANAALERPGGPRLLIPPNPGNGRSSRPGHLRMRRRLAQPACKALYRRRGAIVEPVFGHVKAVRGVQRFQRRGTAACASEWGLLCTTHNLLKLWRHERRRDALRRITGPS